VAAKIRFHDRICFQISNISTNKHWIYLYKSKRISPSKGPVECDNDTSVIHRGLYSWWNQISSIYSQNLAYVCKIKMLFGWRFTVLTPERIEESNLDNRMQSFQLRAGQFFKSLLWSFDCILSINESVIDFASFLRFWDMKLDANFLESKFKGLRKTWKQKMIWLPSLVRVPLASESNTWNWIYMLNYDRCALLTRTISSLKMHP
jgi:hypothetical protein